MKTVLFCGGLGTRLRKFPEPIPKPMAYVGQRLIAVRCYLQGETEFLADYSDGLSHLHLPTYLDRFHALDKTASFMLVRLP